MRLPVAVVVAAVVVCVSLKASVSLGSLPTSGSHFQKPRVGLAVVHACGASETSNGNNHGYVERGQLTNILTLFAFSSSRAVVHA